MKIGYIFIALLMFLYLAASFMGSGDIGIIFLIAKAAQSLSSGRFPFAGVYDAGIVVYVIVMISLFVIGGRHEPER